MRKSSLPLTQVAVSALLLCGCVAETVRKNPPRRGPVKEIGYVDMGGGEVRYSTDGWEWFVSGRRRAAVALMRHICGKLKPVVVDEFPREDADVPYAQDDINVTMQRGDEHFTLAPYNHMVFECSFISTGPVTVRYPEFLPMPSPSPVAVAPPVETPAPVISSAAVTVGIPSPVSVSSAAVPASAAMSVTTAVAPAVAPAPPPPPRPAAAWVAFPLSWASPPPEPAPALSSAAAIGAKPSEVKLK